MKIETFELMQKIKDSLKESGLTFDDISEYERIDVETSEEYVDITLKFSK